MPDMSVTIRSFSHAIEYSSIVHVAMCAKKPNK